MTRNQLDLLIRMIDAKIAENNAADSSDGGLIESMTVMELTRALEETIPEYVE